MQDSEAQKYPLGPYVEPANISDVDVDSLIRVIRDFPERIRNLVDSWTDQELDMQYREGSWTARQLINHLADSSMHGYIRFKRVLTERNPTVAAFSSKQWAELQDSINVDIEPALQILSGVHKRWVYELKSLTNKELEFAYNEPAVGRTVTLRQFLAYCAWHCEHHLAHLQNIKNAD